MMSKYTALAIISFVFFLVFPQVVKAGPIISIDPAQTTTLYPDGIRINITDLLVGKRYNLAYQFNGGQKKGITDGKQQNFSPDSNGELSFLLCPTGSGGYKFESSCNNNFPEGTYSLLLFEDGKPTTSISNASFIVTTLTVAEINCTNNGFTTSDDIKISINGLPDKSYKVLVDGNAEGNCHDSSGSKFEYTLGKYYTGQHSIQVFKNNSLIPVTGCSKGDLIAQGSFTISNDLNNPGSCTSTAANTAPIPVAKVCTEQDIKDGKCTSGGGKPVEGCSINGDPKNPGIATAIGCLHTNPAEFVKDLLKFVLGIGGGLAFLMMLLGAFQMLTSAGNPDTLNAGRDRLTSAVIGLLFVIFSILLLQIIGADILQIPGFIR